MRLFILLCLLIPFKADGQEPPLASLTGLWTGQIYIKDRSDAITGSAYVSINKDPAKKATDVWINFDGFSNKAKVAYGWSEGHFFSNGLQQPTVSLEALYPIGTTHESCKGNYVFTLLHSDAGVPFLYGTYQHKTNDCSDVITSLILFEKMTIKKFPKGGLPDVQNAIAAYLSQPTVESKASSTITTNIITHTTTENAVTSAYRSVDVAPLSDHDSRERLYDVTILRHATSACEWDTTLYYYQTMLGILVQLSAYRISFLNTHNDIDIFPTAYYHTTFEELERIQRGEFKYAVNKMKQMLAFYDAYKWNRTHWDAGQKEKALVENHWKRHFESATEEILLNNSPCLSGFRQILSTGIDAHVKCDLGRAIRSAVGNAYPDKVNNSIYNEEMKGEFDSTNTVFSETEKRTIADINSVSYCPTLLFEAGSEVIKIWNEIFGGSIIAERQKAWEKALNNQPLLDLNKAPLKPQPPTYRKELQKIGAVYVKNDTLDDGAAFLFKRVKTNLSIGDKNNIYRMLGYTFSKEMKQFDYGEDAGILRYFDVVVDVKDLNGDGNDEVFIHALSSFYAGHTGIFTTLFIKRNCIFEQNFGFGGIALPLSSYNLGYPDIMIGGPGLDYPIWRWSGAKYMLYKRVHSPSAEYDRLRITKLPNMVTY